MRELKNKQTQDIQAMSPPHQRGEALISKFLEAYF